MFFLGHRREKRGKGIAILIPFRSDHGRRAMTLNWLLQFWKTHLPAAKIVIGIDDHVPFSKTSAFNDAVSKASKHCDIFVLMDADCYINPATIVHCAKEIRQARKRKKPLWFIPYRRFYRLTDAASLTVLESDPAGPFLFTERPPVGDCLPSTGESQGHWWGALVQVMPREAFAAAGGMDPRFQGWGGEDVAFMRAVDTLYGRHKTTKNFVTHLWHPMNTTSEKTVTGVANMLRAWDGQNTGRRNDQLANRYYAAFGDYARMRNLVDEYRTVR